MQNSQETALMLEWSTLQNQFDAFEKYSLLIKLFAVAVTVVFLFDIKHPEIVVVINSLLWVQDAIWKTFQSRFSIRLLAIEAQMSESPVHGSIRFNTSWEASRSGISALLGEYLRHLVKPTVVFPHVVLLAVACYLVFSSI